jgi:predicted MPP superfamily phosphohydrolase
MASGAAFLLPFGVHALSKSSTPSATILFTSDVHNTPRNVSDRMAQTMLAERGVDLVVLGGDIGDENCTLYDMWWDAPYAAVRARWRVVSASGNHDNSACFTQRFGVLPRKASLNDVDFFILPWGVRISEADSRWLDQETAASLARWKVLVVHKPIWNVSPEDGRVHEPPASLLPILARIDLVLAGHNHVYWDSTHVVGGRSVRQIIEVASSKFYECVPAAVGCVARSRGFSRVEFAPDGIRVSRRVVQ